MTASRVSSFPHRGAPRPAELAPAPGHPSRKQPEAPPKPAEAGAGRSVRIGGAAADLAEGRVRASDGAETVLRPQSAAVLRALADRRGETVTKDELHAAVWGDIAVTEDSLVQCIGDIRRALGPDRDALRTLPKRGYRLMAEGRALSRLGWRTPVAAAALLAVLLAGLLLRDRPPPAQPAAAPVVAVLPFENLSEPGRWDRLARGVTEEVIADLAANSWIFVLADATTRPHAGETPQAAAGALGADHVVTGTLQVEGDRVRVNATLADASSGRQVWTKRWEGPAGDLLAIQAAASQALVGELAGRLSGAIVRADTARAHGAGTASLDAYDLFLLAAERKQSQGFALPALVAAEADLTRAVEIDPGFGRAWSMLALIQGMQTASVTTEAELDALEERRRASLARAVAVAPDDPSTLVEIAKQAARDDDPAAVARTLRRAIALAPNDADILAHAAWLAAEGAPLGPEAVAWAERALTLNPGGPTWYQTALGVAAFAVGDHARAAEALASDPSAFPDRLLYLAAAEAMLGHADAAKAAGDRLRELVPGFDLAFYMDGWPWEPGLWDGLHEGAVRAGLGGTPVDDR